jgi:manganese/zinc/iron transport system permease protein
MNRPQTSNQGGGIVVDVSLERLPLLMADGLWRAILLRDHNTRVVLLATVLLGLGAGVLGVYLLLRKRVLIGDAISHATLPGVAIAYLLTASDAGGKSLVALLIGAAISGGLGGIAVVVLRQVARIREDASLGTVLSVFFGLGVALVSIVQQLPIGSAAGLESYIYGKAALMTPADAWLCGSVTGMIILTCFLFGKELKLLCFDSELAKSQGSPVLFLEGLLIALVVAITIVGLQGVGLIMIIALLVVPAASARFWTHSLTLTLIISGCIGASSCAVGTLLSATYAKVPSGATIVLCSCAVFAISFAFGASHGVVWRSLRQWQLRRKQETQHLLRAAFEILEEKQQLPEPRGILRSSPPIDIQEIGRLRGWSQRRTRQLAEQLAGAGLVMVDSRHSLQLTPRGFLRAIALVRDHRLLEQYMIEEVAAEVFEADRAADLLEHDLLPEHLAQLEQSFTVESPNLPPNPHGGQKE